MIRKTLRRKSLLWRVPLQFSIFHYYPSAPPLLLCATLETPTPSGLTPVSVDANGREPVTSLSQIFRLRVGTMFSIDRTLLPDPYNPPAPAKSSKQRGTRSKSRPLYFRHHVYFHDSIPSCLPFPTKVRPPQGVPGGNTRQYVRLAKKFLT